VTQDGRKGPQERTLDTQSTGVTPPVVLRRLEAADEVALIDRVAHGDNVAFEILFRSYYPRISRFLERMVRRPQLIDEVLNDTMLVVWRKADTFNLRSTVST
jgi:Sigma-70 region 2